MKKQTDIECAQARVDAMREQKRRLEVVLLAEQKKLDALKDELEVAENTCGVAWQELFGAWDLGVTTSDLTLLWSESLKRKCALAQSTKDTLNDRQLAQAMVVDTQQLLLDETECCLHQLEEELAELQNVFLPEEC